MIAARAIAATALALLLAGSLAGCSVYKIDIQQGNVLTQDMIDQLEPGMTKSQVAYVMGRPVLENTFRPNRWDYVYTIDTGYGATKQQRMTLFFEGDELARMEGDIAPSGAG